MPEASDMAPRFLAPAQVAELLSIEVDEVIDLVQDELIVLRWDGGTDADNVRYKTTVEMKFDALDDGGTMVTISENGWREDDPGRRGTYLNCEGWSNMLCCMKAFVEYGINLRDGMFLSEMRGVPAEAPDYEKLS